MSERFVGLLLGVTRSFTEVFVAGHSYLQNDGLTFRNQSTLAVVRAYQVGRLIDPAHPELMAEAHPVYRLEFFPHWNLHLGSPNAANFLNPPPDSGTGGLRTRRTKNYSNLN